MIFVLDPPPAVWTEILEFFVDQLAVDSSAR
jgi:hypothetical protein